MRARSILIFVVAAMIASGAQKKQPGEKLIDLKSDEGTLLKATYFAAANPGPGVLLFHQSNRTRKSWEDVAHKLVAAGMNVLTLDSGPKKTLPADLDAAFEFLVSQPGVNRNLIGAGGAGALGVHHAVETAHRHSAEVKSLVLLSGETTRPQLQFLQHASQLPGLFVVSDDDEYPPTQQAMQLLYDTSGSPSKKMIHYAAAQEAPWRWYEPFDIGKVPAKGGHGTDLFKGHPDLPGIITDWFVTTLIKTPGHAPADTIACAAIINQLQQPEGIEPAARQLTAARETDPQAQLFPEIAASIIGQDYMRDGDLKSAIKVFELILLAYPSSADDQDNLASAYLKDGQKDLAREHAEKALSILDARAGPASSWTDTEEYRGEIRRDAQKILSSSR